MTAMTDDYRKTFLAKVRYGYLTTLTRDGAPKTVPVWYDWDGQTVRIFTGKGSGKVKRIRHDPRVTLLVANDLSENEAWVSFDGLATIQPEGGFELAERLAARYWDLSDPERQATVASWKASSENLCVIAFVPSRIRTYFE